MDVDGIRVEKPRVGPAPELPGAAAPGNCQRKSSRGAGAEPLQDCSLRRPLQQQTDSTLSSYLRDNSDLKNGANGLAPQTSTAIYRVEADHSAEPEYLSECSPRDKPWDTHRADADRVAEMYASHPEFQNLSGRVALCSLLLGFAWAPDRLDASALTLKLRVARFCRVRHCPICQWRRSLMWLARFYAALPRVLAGAPNARFVFLTLTLENVAVGDLRSTLRAMNKAWERLAQRKKFRAILGWIRATEVTRSKDGSAHPHFHVLLMVPSSYFSKHYLTQAKWAEMWRDASRVAYTPYVDVRAVKQAIIAESGILPAVRETLKYSVKPSDMTSDPGWFLEITRQLRKLRFIACGGVLKNVLRPEEETEKDLVAGLGGTDPSNEMPSLFFDWQSAPKRYKRTARPRKSTMQAPEFSFDGLIEALAKRVAEHVRVQLAQDGLPKVKPRLLSIEQAATYLGRTEEAVQHMVSSGKIQTVRFDRRVFLDIRDLDRLIDDNKVSGIR